MKVYATIMRRWGDEESHHYLLGVFGDKDTAIEEGLKETIHRGNKYEPAVFGTDLNAVNQREVVYDTSQEEQPNS